MPLAIDSAAAVDRLLRFLSVEGITGQEANIGKEIVAALTEAGVPASAIRYDDANTRIPAPTQTGNIIVDLPGTLDAPRILFMTHMDTVPLCAGAKPRLAGKKVVNDAATALGGDNRTGCAVLVTLAAELLRRGAGLTAIGQVLRHQDLATTALYAKVDLDTLRGVAQPWPTAVTA